MCYVVPPLCACQRCSCISNGNQWLLKEIRHVPDLRKNLISTGQLASEGCVSIFTDKMWKVIKRSLVIEKGEKVLGPHIVPFLPILFAIVIPFITCI
jgi:hypothetical protein